MKITIVPGIVNEVVIDLDMEDRTVDVFIDYEYESETGGHQSSFVRWHHRGTLEWFLADLMNVTGVTKFKDIKEKKVRLQIGPHPDENRTVLVGIGHETDDEWLWTI